VRAWVGEDGLLRRQVLMKGTQVQMDATFRITDKNPHIGPGVFRFDPPSDYQVQDLTESTIKALRSIESPSH
jgi:outer membrane lipoprotein-sorting protein